METLLFIVALVLALIAISMWSHRKDDRDCRIRDAEDAARGAEFWSDELTPGDDPDVRLARDNLESIRKPYATGWKRFVFSLQVLAALVPALLIFAFLYLNNEDASLTPLFVIAVAGFLYFETIVKPLDSLQRDVAWLNRTVRSLKARLDQKKEKEYEPRTHVSPLLKRVQADVAYARLLRQELYNGGLGCKPDKEKDYTERYKKVLGDAVRGASELDDPNHDETLSDLIELCLQFLETSDFKHASALMQRMRSDEKRREAAQQISSSYAYEQRRAAEGAAIDDLSAGATAST